MVAHDVNPILPYLDRVVYLAEGGAASAPRDEVITSETLTAAVPHADRGARDRRTAGSSSSADAGGARPARRPARAT